MVAFCSEYPIYGINLRSVYKNRHSFALIPGYEIGFKPKVLLPVCANREEKTISRKN